MKWNIGRKLGAGYALALMALIVIGTVSYRSSIGLMDTAGKVTHTYRVLGDLEQLLSYLKDTETGERGFVITGEDRYLDPYNEASGKLDQMVKEIKDLTSDNVNQQQRISRLEPLISDKISTIKETISARKDPQKGFDIARQIVLTDKGKKTMDDIRKVVLEMEDEENTLLKQRAGEAAGSSAQNQATIIWGTVIAAIVLSLAGYWITSNISRPINEISGIAEKVATGDLSAAVTVTNRDDEIGMLSKNFARMIRSLQEMAAVAKKIALCDLRMQIKPQSEKDELGNAFAIMTDSLRRSTAELAEGVNVLASSASEILAATTQVASGAAETGTAIAETTTTVEEVKQTAQNSSQKARAVSDSAQKVIQVAQSGRKSVDATIDGMKRIQAQVESIAESVVKLSEQSQAIGEIIASVNDLAEQSNLLAVNAAIEAAKAGEHGKGFSVVAQEVKSLAEQSKQATAQVRTILNDIQKATTAAVLATEQGNKAVESGMKQSAEAGESIRMLAESITEAAQAATQIAASSQQQMVGTDQVAMAMENIKQASSQNVAGTKQAEAAAHNLHDLGQKLKQLVDQYKV